MSNQWRGRMANNLSGKLLEVEIVLRFIDQIFRCFWNNVNAKEIFWIFSRIYKSIKITIILLFGLVDLKLRFYWFNKHRFEAISYSYNKNIMLRSTTTTLHVAYTPRQIIMNRTFYPNLLKLKKNVHYFLGKKSKEIKFIQRFQNFTGCGPYHSHNIY